MKHTHIPHEKLERLGETLARRGLGPDMPEPAALALLAMSGLVDKEYYYLNNPDVKEAGLDPVSHYCRFGWREGRSPNLWFETALYKNENPDIPTNVNPLLHYVARGHKEKRRPNKDARKQRGRLIVSLSPRSLSLSLLRASLRSLLNQSLRADKIVLQLDVTSHKNRQFCVGLMELLEEGIDINWVDNLGSYQALMPALEDYPNDVIVTCSLDNIYEPNFLENLYAAWRARPDCVHCNAATSLYVNDNAFGIDFGMRSSKGMGDYLVVPHAHFGVILAAQGLPSLATERDIYLRHAPVFSDLWLWMNASLAGRKVNVLASASDISNFIGLRGDYIQSLNKDREVFSKEAIALAYCFKEELKSLTGVDVYEHMIRPRVLDLYAWKMKRDADLETCPSFGEKLQYLKLYDDIPLKGVLSDKYLAREYIRKSVGEEYLPRLLGVWRNFDDIDFAQLPSQFVLKLSCGSGTNIIVENKNELDLDRAKASFNKWADTNYALSAWEMNYFHLRPIVMAEEYLGDNINDYKILCNAGIPELIFVDVDRFKGHKRNIYDPNWTQLNWKFDYPATLYELKRPRYLPLLLELASKMTKPFIHARADFFIIDDSVKVGEITFYSESGFWNITPHKAAFKLGKSMKLKSVGK